MPMYDKEMKGVACVFVSVILFFHMYLSKHTCVIPFSHAWWFLVKVWLSLLAADLAVDGHRHSRMVSRKDVAKERV